MEENINILFLGGAKRVSLAEKFIEEGKILNKNVTIFSYELDVNVPISFVGKIIIGLKWNDPKLYEHLQQVVKENNISIILPFLDYATIVASKLKKMIPEVFIPVSEIDLCEVFFNKEKANNWGVENKINIPGELSNFPLIAKPITGSASKGIIKIVNQEELNHLANKETYLIQQFITGKEYSFDIYVSPITKELISIVSRERLETQGGESIKSITIKDKNLLDFGKSIIEKSNLVGPLTLQILEDGITKELFFMEINPRYGGAVVNSIFAGANSPKYLLQDYLGIKNTYNEDWKDHFMMVRRFSEYYKICN